MRGKLIVTGTKVELKYINAKDKEVTQIVSRNDLSRQLRTLPDAGLNGLEVDFDLVGGAPKKFRPIDQPFEEQAPPKPAGRPGQGPQPRRDAPPRPAPVLKGEYHNPYNFVPAPEPKLVGEFGHQKPAPHDRYHDNRFTGTIAVKLTTVTPLLLPDAFTATEDKSGHKSFSVRRGSDGRPALAVTTLKGMLRSAFEAVTNSRFAVFPFDEDRGTGHAARLAYRRQAKVDVEPARIAAVGPDEVEVHILRQRWLRSPAKLPRYDKRDRNRDHGRAHAAMYYAGSRKLPAHGDHVWARIDERTGRALDIRPFADADPGGDWWEGYVCINNANIGNKTSERVFVVTNKDEIIHFRGPEAQRVRRLWGELIRNYQETHERDLEKRANNGKPDDYHGDKPGQTAWSRHVYEKGADELKEGTLCYIRRDDRGQIVALYPVAISRDLFDASPVELLPDNLRPASDLSELSMADRVFGWVNPQGNGAYLGNVRIGPIACTTDNAIDVFPAPGVPLAILGQPKPQQARFYVGANKDGDAQPSQPKDRAGFTKAKGLRGRKVYPHHQLPFGYWDNPMDDRTQQPQGKQHQEYRRPKLDGRDQRDDQNRTIRDWVRIGAEFTFDIHVTNLSEVELGALLWLLALPDKCCHRLGGGKPLGFGSVRLDVASLQVRTGQEMRDYYLSFAAPEIKNGDVKPFKDRFEKALADAYSKPFGEVPFTKAFLRAAEGFADQLPIHYPRTRQPGQTGPMPPHPEGKSFEWFAANDRGAGVSLPNLAADAGLPTLEVKDTRR